MAPSPGPIVGLVGAAAIFGVAVFVPTLLPGGTALRIASTQLLEVSLSLLAIVVWGGGAFRAYGFTWPRSDASGVRRVVRWLPVAALALATGGLTSFVILVAGVDRNPLLEELSFPQVVLLVWITSSMAEEVLARGFLQGHLTGPSTPPRGGIDGPTLASALFFSSMHLVLLLRGISLANLAITMAFTFALGLLAGHQRAVSKSLVPAIGVHVLGNVGTLLGGIAYAIVAIAMGWPLQGA
jgi:membrane protease YdiL (CAAX protease family)